MGVFGRMSMILVIFCKYLSQKGGFVNDSSAIVLDDADYRIISALSEDARISDVSIGEKINLSSSPVARRRKSLEENGIISGYEVRLDPSRLGFSGVVAVSIELTSQAEQVLVDFENEVLKSKAISYCGFVSGDTDFLLLIHVSSFNEYDAIYRSELSILPHVGRIRSSFVLRQVTNCVNPPAFLVRR